MSNYPFIPRAIPTAHTDIPESITRSESTPRNRIYIPTDYYRSHCFAFKVRDDSMSPVIEYQDCLIAEDTNHRFKHDDLVGVLPTTGGHFFCRRIKFESDETLLVPDNPGADYSIIPVDDRILIIGRVIGQYRFLPCLRGEGTS